MSTETKSQPPNYWNTVVGHTMTGWVAMGGYVKKWFLYNIYALGIKLGFALYLFAVGLIGGIGLVFHDLLGVLFGVLAFIFLPALIGYHRGDPSETEPKNEAGDSGE